MPLERRTALSIGLDESASGVLSFTTDRQDRTILRDILPDQQCSLAWRKTYVWGNEEWVRGNKDSQEDPDKAG